jgi:hypothetical protein
MDTHHIQTHAELPDTSSQHKRKAVQHETYGPAAYVSADSCNQLLLLFYKRRKLVDRFVVRCEITFVVENT